MALLRRICFWLFAAIYVVACPLTILYALGYLLAPGPEPELVETGLVSVATLPPGATVYLGRQRYAHKTPTQVRGLRPGRYPIRVVFKARRPWQGTVPVEAGQATALERVLLRPRTWASTELSPEPFDQLIPIPGSRTLLLTRGSVLGEAMAFTWDDGRLRPLLPPDSPWREARLQSWVTVRDSPTLLLRVASWNGERMLWLDPRRAEPSVVDMTPWVPPRAARAVWSPRAPTRLFVSRDGALTRVDVPSGEVQPRLVDGVRGVGVANGTLYVLTETAGVQRLDADGQRPEPILDDPALGQSLFGEAGWFRIEALSDDLLLFLGERGQLVANRLPYRLVDAGVQDLAWDPRHDRLLVWQPRRLGVVDVAEASRAGEQFEQGPTLQWIMADATHVEQAFWVYEGSHVLCRDRGQVLLIELETYGPPRVERVVSTKRRSAVWYAEETGQLYYLHPTSRRLRALELLPKREFLR